MKAGWRVVPLGEVCTVVNGGTPKSIVATYWGGDVNWLTPKDMGQMTGRHIAETPRKITAKGLDNCSARLVPAGSVIMSTRAPIGHLAINDAPMAFNQGCRGMMPGANLDPVFLFHFLSANTEALNDLGTGTTFKELSATALRAFPIPLPPLDEQKRIVAVLDEAFEGLSRARANAEANLADARELSSRHAAALFDRVAMEAKSTRRVAEIAAPEKGSIRTGPFGSQLLHSEFVESGVAVLGIDNAVKNEFQWAKRRFITEEKYKELSRYTVRPGDVIITIMGTCGRCAVVPDDIPKAINTKHLCCITLDQRLCNPDFLHAYFLHSPVARDYLDSQVLGSIMDGLNMGIIKEMPVTLPTLEVQKDVVSAISEMRGSSLALSAFYSDNIAELDTLRQSLLQKAFSGELT